MKLNILLIAAMSLFMGQSQLNLNKEKSSIMIYGTSSVHDWESEAKQYTITGTKDDQSIKNLKVTIKTESIKSGKSIMDDKTYDALLKDKYPNIIFQAGELKIAGSKVSGTGKLTLAGKSKSVAINGKVISNSNNQIQIEGSNKVNMTEYGIEPPTAMFGSLVTGEEVTIKYNITLNY